VNFSRVFRKFRNYVCRLFLTDFPRLSSTLPRKNPVNTLSGKVLELEQKLNAERVLPPFVLGELGLGDSKDLGKLHLTHFKPAYLSDSSTDSFKVRGAGRIWFVNSHCGYIIVPVVISSSRRCGLLYLCGALEAKKKSGADS